MAGPDEGVYAGTSDLTGPLVEPREEPPRVRYRDVMSPFEKRATTALALLNIIAGVLFVGWLLQPENLPTTDRGAALLWVARIGFVGIVVVELVRISQGATMWFFTGRMRDPVPMEPPADFRVAVLTTMVPSKEPIDLLTETLAAMRQVTYDAGTVDVWVLDEGDDERVRAVCDELGVKHFTRSGRPEYNQESGPFRAKTKHGNHNAWRAEHESEYDVVMQADPDHVPRKDFLQRTLGYFRDPDVAFVVAPQVYGNITDGFVPHGAAAQAYIFQGVIQRGGNGWGAPLLIGTNHLYRTRAWHQIGGYQDSIIEDHLTSMKVQGVRNEETGGRWKGVYTPDILSVGEGPASWSAYFDQQKRWAYGIWEIIIKHGRLLGDLSRTQRLSYSLLQTFYPSVAVAWVLGNTLTALYLLAGITAIEIDIWTWLPLWLASFGTQLGLWSWLRRFNLAEHERRDRGFAGLALALMTGPVYVSAAFSAVLRRPLKYAVTAKGEAAGDDPIWTFRPHLGWAAAASIALGVSLWLGHEYAALRAWGLFALIASLSPIIVWAGQRVRRTRSGQA